MQENFDEAYKNPDNIRIIKKACSRFNDSLSKEALNNCGAVALWRALKNQKKRRLRKKFSTSLWEFVVWECLDEIKRQKDKLETIPLLQEPIHYPNKILQEIQYILNDEEYDILIQRYIGNKTLKEIGISKGITKQAVFSRIQNIRKKAKDALENGV